MCPRRAKDPLLSLGQAKGEGLTGKAGTIDVLVPDLAAGVQ
jgi:hypothetical protein